MILSVKIATPVSVRREWTNSPIHPAARGKGKMGSVDPSVLPVIICDSLLKSVLIPGFRPLCRWRDVLEEVEKTLPNLT